MSRRRDSSSLLPSAPIAAYLVALTDRAQVDRKLVRAGRRRRAANRRAGRAARRPPGRHVTAISPGSSSSSTPSERGAAAPFLPWRVRAAPTSRPSPTMVMRAGAARALQRRHHARGAHGVHLTGGPEQAAQLLGRRRRRRRAPGCGPWPLPSSPPPARIFTAAMPPSETSMPFASIILAAGKLTAASLPRRRRCRPAPPAPVSAARPARRSSPSASASGRGLVGGGAVNFARSAFSLSRSATAAAAARRSLGDGRRAAPDGTLHLGIGDR